MGEAVAAGTFPVAGRSGTAGRSGASRSGDCRAPGQVWWYPNDCRGSSLLLSCEGSTLLGEHGVTSGGTIVVACGFALLGMVSENSLVAILLEILSQFFGSLIYPARCMALMYCSIAFLSFPICQCESPRPAKAPPCLESISSVLFDCSMAWLSSRWQ